jgi:hypothetical protein
MDCVTPLRPSAEEKQRADQQDGDQDEDYVDHD